VENIDLVPTERKKTQIFNDGNMLATITKKKKSNPKQPSCKKVLSPKKAIVKKDVKSKVVAKKSL